MKSEAHLYAKVTNEIRQQIDSGKYRDGDKLPSERQLCKEFGVSRITIRQALDRLEEMKIIDRKQGKGTYILPFEYGRLPEIFSRFVCEIEKKGKQHGTKVLHIGRISVDAHLAEKMGLPEGGQVYKVSRLRTVDDLPLAVEHSYIPCGAAPGLDVADIGESSLYQILEGVHSVKIDRAFETLQPAVLNGEDAAHLGRMGGEAVLNIERFAYAAGRMIEYTGFYFIDGEYKYTVDLI
ncbi:GntR family transcriptional regulator [Lacicoccus alkaliphilus]|uniref:GntR family transcriptional regulator n=1 Tax=Lacicoccus alkaliphilus DSM 16010 TaxID=1123231 RepID=A0A1M7JME9_9BACL|nr:GntR family transcriptional regulator [Salinicoccus alkaliphilus]SHM53707.1 GntR family transcriptional regulator [Salinicoccus alkaliphilus DSM 16010]